MITANQIRAARALLDISQGALAEAAGVSANTISNVEKGATPALDTLWRIQAFFETKGVEFLDGEGIRKKQGNVESYAGHEGFVQFIRDVYETTKDGGEIFVSNVNENDFLKWEGDEAQPHMTRMASIKKLKFLIMIAEEDTNIVASEYATYRAVPKESFSDIPLYLYGDKTAIINFSEKNVEVFVIQHKAITQYFRQSFMQGWINAKEITNA